MCAHSTVPECLLMKLELSIQEEIPVIVFMFLLDYLFERADLLITCGNVPLREWDSSAIMFNPSKVILQVEFHCEIQNTVHSRK